MAWIVEHGEYFQGAMNIYLGHGPYSYAGNRWRDTLTDLADPTGKHTWDIGDKIPVDLASKLYIKKTPGWGDIGFAGGPRPKGGSG